MIFEALLLCAQSRVQSCVPTRAGAVLRCAAIVFAALLVSGWASAAPQAAQTDNSSTAPKTHKPVARHAHHASSAHRAHSTAAAHKAHATAHAQAKPAAAQTTEQQPAPASASVAETLTTGKIETSAGAQTAAQPEHPADGSQAAQPPAAAAAAGSEVSVTSQPAAAGAAEQTSTPTSTPAPATADSAPTQQPAQSTPDSAATQQPATNSAGNATGQSPPAQATPAQAESPAQAPATTPTVQVAPAGENAAPPADQAASAPAPTPVPTSFNFSPKTVTEEELRQLLVGKTLYVRGGYLDNNLSFDENGRLASHSPIGSYTLSGIQIERVHLSKHKVELEGARYGLHFLGSLPYEDPTKAVDRVKITPKKKFVKITIDRELVVTPKKKKTKGGDKAAEAANAKAAPGAQEAPADSSATPDDQSQAVNADNAAAQSPAQSTDQAANGAAAKPEDKPADKTDAKTEATSADKSDEQEAADQAKAEMAAAPAEEQPVAPGSVTTTIHPEHAAHVLGDALDHVFAQGLDEKMMAAMPDFWKLYYAAVAARSDYKPQDPGVLRQGGVDQKAKLLSNFEPQSNDFAQDAGVAGMCLYHTVIGADGKPGEISVARPIGFGLDENAVEAIRKASFQPAMKDGKPVPVVLDLVVQFRIYSKRTNVASKPEDKDKPKEAQLPGPYTLRDPPKETQNQ